MTALIIVPTSRIDAGWAFVDNHEDHCLVGEFCATFRYGGNFVAHSARPTGSTTVWRCRMIVNESDPLILGYELRKYLTDWRRMPAD
jgi:hypothetical protein